MLSWRHVLLVLVVFFAQLAAGAHAVEHVAGHDEGLPTHACELCMAAHDLGAALPSLAVLPAEPVAHDVPAVLAVAGRHAVPAPLAAQRGPPRT